MISRDANKKGQDRSLPGVAPSGAAGEGEVDDLLRKRLGALLECLRDFRTQARAVGRAFSPLCDPKNLARRDEVPDGVGKFWSELDELKKERTTALLLLEKSCEQLVGYESPAARRVDELIFRSSALIRDFLSVWSDDPNEGSRLTFPEDGIGIYCYPRTASWGETRHRAELKDRLHELAAVMNDLSTFIDEIDLARRLKAIQGGRAANSFQKHGAVWFLSYAGKHACLPGYAGLDYIRFLLQHRGVTYTTAKLLAAIHDRPVRLLSGDEELDDESVRSYGRRLREIDTEIGEAKGRGDYQRQEGLQSEKERIAEQLRTSRGLGGRKRKVGDQAKAESNRIGKATTDAVAKIGDAGLNELAQHLRNSIRPYSQALEYRPSDPVDWAL